MTTNGGKYGKYRKTLVSRETEFVAGSGINPGGT
jgi:hypothetical protein